MTAFRERSVARDAAPAVFGAAGARKAVAVPVLLDGVPVGVIYGDHEEAAVADDSWSDRLELVAAHGATRLGYLTAMRTAQAMRWIAGRDGVTVSSRQPCRLV